MIFLILLKMKFISFCFVDSKHDNFQKKKEDKEKLLNSDNVMKQYLNMVDS